MYSPSTRSNRGGWGGPVGLMWGLLVPFMVPAAIQELAIWMVGAPMTSLFYSSLSLGPLMLMHDL